MMSKIIPLRKNEKADTKSFHHKLCVKDKFTEEPNKILNTAYMKLLGPISYYYYPNINGRTILLVGDFHTPTTKCMGCNNDDVCMDINEYLTRIIRQDLVPEKEKKCIDFFMETAYLFSDKQKKDFQSGGRRQTKKKCKLYNKFDTSRKLPGIKGRFFDINTKIPYKKTIKINNGTYPYGTNMNIKMTGVVCDTRGSKIKFSKYSKSKPQKKCISRKESGISRTDILSNLRNTYLNPKIDGEILVSILAKTNSLSFVRKNFNICSLDSDFCANAYPFLRYHYFDIRQIGKIYDNKEYKKLLSGKVYKGANTKEILFPSVGMSGNKLKTTLLEKFKPLSNIKIQQNLLLFCLGESTPNNIGEQIYDEMLKVTTKKETFSYKISKQLIKIISLKVQKQFNNTTINKKKLINFIMNLYEEHHNAPIGYIVYPLLIDVYLLSRMFRKYDDKTKNKRAAPGCHTNISKNIIVYAGQYHIDIYIKYFNKVYGIKPTIEIKPSNTLDIGKSRKCIDIPHIQPFGIPIFDKKYSSGYPHL